MTRILLVANTGWNIRRYRLGFIKHLVETGHQVHVACPDDGLVAGVLETAGARYHALTVRPAGLHPVEDARFLAGLTALCLRLRPETLHLFTLKPALFGATLARFLGIRRIVATLTGMGAWRQSWDQPLGQKLTALARFAWASDRVSVVVQNSDDLELLRQSGLVPEERLHLVYGSGVPLVETTPLSRDEPVTFLMVSRMLWPKGVEAFVTAGQYLHTVTGGRSRFLLVGGSAEDYASDNPAFVDRDWLEAVNSEANGVEWLGFVAPERLDRLMQDARAVVLPSTYPEGIPRALLEAMSAARPVITCDTPGCREAVPDDWQSGLLLQPGDQFGLNAACLGLFRDADQAEALGREARRLVELRFAADRVNAAQAAVGDDVAGAPVAIPAE